MKETRRLLKIVTERLNNLEAEAKKPVIGKWYQIGDTVYYFQGHGVTTYGFVNGRFIEEMPAYSKHFSPEEVPTIRVLSLIDRHLEEIGLKEGVVVRCLVEEDGDYKFSNYRSVGMNVRWLGEDNEVWGKDRDGKGMCLFKDGKFAVIEKGVRVTLDELEVGRWYKYYFNYQGNDGYMVFNYNGDHKSPQKGFSHGTSPAEYQEDLNIKSRIETGTRIEIASFEEVLPLIEAEAKRRGLVAGATVIDNVIGEEAYEIKLGDEEHIVSKQALMDYSELVKAFNEGYLIYYNKTTEIIRNLSDLVKPAEEYTISQLRKGLLCFFSNGRKGGKPVLGTLSSFKSDVRKLNGSGDKFVENYYRDLRGEAFSYCEPATKEGVLEYIVDFFKGEFKEY